MADLAASLNPQIPLGVQVPQAQSLAINPVEMLGHLATMQNQLNQARLFQQTFAAKMQAGQIISQSPDLDTGVKNLLGNPSVMGFAPEIANVLRQFQLTGAQISGENLKQSQSAFHFAQQMLPMIVANPQSAGYVFDAARKLLPTGGANAAANVALNDLMMAAANGTNAPGMTPAQVNAKIQANAAGIMTSAGMSPDLQSGVGGRGVIQDVGSGYQSFVQAPPLMGGGMTPTGPVIPKGLAPQVAQAGGVFVGGQPGQQGGLPYPSPEQSGLAVTQPASGGTAGTFVGGISPTQKEYMQHRGADMANYQKTLDTTVDSMYGVMQNINEAQKAMQSFRPGGGSSAYAGLAQFAQAFGASNETVDSIARGDLGAVQEFQKLMVGNVMGQIRQQLPPGSRLAQYEFQQFQKNNPHIDTDPRAIEKVFNFWGKLYNQASDEQSSFNTFLDSGGDISHWPARWQQIAKEKGYVGGSIVGGQQTGAASTGAGLAATPPTYNSASDVAAAYKAGHISRDAAAKVLRDRGWAQ